MAKNIQHGPLYEHAKRELEAAGISSGKGNLDQKLSSTVLKLVDIFEYNANTDTLQTMIRNLFVTFSAHDIINPPTDDPDEWTLARDADGDYLVLRRAPEYFSKDGGVSWYRQGVGSGLSLKVTKEDEDAAIQEEKDV